MRLRIAAAGALLALAGCGTVTPPAPAAVAVPASVNVLSPSAVPGVPYTTRALTTAELDKDAPIAELPSMLSSWGYVEGAERTFQGQSPRLTFVVSRSMLFRNEAGAAAFVAFVHSHVTDYFGVAAVEAFTAQRRAGWQITPSACACHMANPSIVGIVSAGEVVSWLEINGPQATPSLLISLMDPSNSVPAA